MLNAFLSAYRMLAVAVP